MLHKYSKTGIIAEYLPVLTAVYAGVDTQKNLKIYLKKSQAWISKTARQLEKQGLLRKTGWPQILELTARGQILVSRQSSKYSKFSDRVKPKNSRVHSVSFKFPILHDHFTGNWDKISNNLTNSIRAYKKIEFPIHVTIEKTTKSIILHLHDKQIDRHIFFTEFTEWIIKTIFYAYHYLKRKGLEFDFLEIQAIKQHVANPSPEDEHILDPRATFSKDLGRQAHFIAPSPQPARAWIDRSLGPLEVETNDLEYEEKYLMVPENVEAILHGQARFHQDLDLYSQNIEKHLAVLDEMSSTLKAIKGALT